MDDEPAQRGAPLPGRADRGEDDRPDRHVEIGGGRHDHPVVAAELQDRPAETRGDLGADDRAHAGRTGGRDDRHVPGLDQGFADRRSADDDLREPVRSVGAEALERAVQDLHGRERRERRLFRRFPDDGVAADERERRVPGPDRDRKVERGDDRAGPERMPGLGHAVAGALRGNDETVQLPRKADGEIADVDHLLHFAETLGNDLAHLQGHKRSEGVFRSAQFLAQEAHELAAARRRNLAPDAKGAPGASNDRRHVGKRRLLNAGDLGAVDRRTDRERAAPKLGRAESHAFENSLLVIGPPRVIPVRERRRPPSPSPLFISIPPARQALRFRAPIGSDVSDGLARGAPLG